MLPARHPGAGAAQPVRRLGAAAGGRHRRLGRGVAGHDRPRQPRAPLAGTGPPARRHRGGRFLPGAPADHLPPRTPPSPTAGWIPPCASPSSTAPTPRAWPRTGPGVVLGRESVPPSCCPVRQAAAQGRRCRRRRCARAGVARAARGTRRRGARRRPPRPASPASRRSTTLFAARGPEVVAVAEVAD